jgi:hypothetical protein
LLIPRLPAAVAMEGDAECASKQQHALRKILLRQKLRLWASKAAQERADLADELVQLFTASSLASASTASPAAAVTAETLALRPITRRPGVEEVRNCVLSAPYPCLPPACAALRGEIWQVLLNVYKRNQHGAAAQEFERMMARLSKLPRDPVLVDECEDVSRLLVPRDEDDLENETKRAQVQSELEILLVWFLTTKSVEYARGMARVVGVFFLLQLPLPTVYDCFYQFCASFLPHFVNTQSPFGVSPAATFAAAAAPVSSLSSSVAMTASVLARLSMADSESDASIETSSLDGDVLAATSDPVADARARKRRERQQLVEQLLSYHDPSLAHFLNQWCPSGWSEPGELVPEELFMDDAYNAFTPRAFVPLMDQYLLTGDAMLAVFVVVATLVGTREQLTALQNGDDVAAHVKSAFQTLLHDETTSQFVCMLASRLRSRTPASYKCSQWDAAKDTASLCCGSRRAMEIAFDDAAKRGAGPGQPKRDVDMSQWQRRESRSLAGKSFWYHTPTGRTQWEHPAELFEPAPALFALPIGVDEVARHVMGDKRAASSSSVGLRYFVVDCRGLRSSDDLKCGKIPAAFTLDPSVFDSPELIERTMAALNPMKSQIHIVLVGDGVGMPPELIKTEDMKTSVRDAVRHDADSMNRAALFFQKKGFRFISCLDGGYSSWHAFMRDDPSSSPHELLCHVEDECYYCRYDTILRTGADPLKQKKKAQPRRKKSAMPTTTTMLVNGGEGDASIISTNEAAAPAPRPAGRRSLTPSLSLNMNMNMNTSLSSMRSKLSDVKMPKLSGWRRSNSTSNQNDSSSETATAEDGGSDRGSSSTTDEGEPRIAEEAAFHGEALVIAEDGVTPAGAPPPSSQEEKSFVGVFTIDYSDDEEDEDVRVAKASSATAKGGDPLAGAAAATAAPGAVATTQSA